jgi:hypothetical protein
MSEMSGQEDLEMENVSPAAAAAVIDLIEK